VEKGRERLEVGMVEKLPIVYVRGFAGDTSGINKTVADPFYGFNGGLTDGRVSGDGEPIFYQFESPLLRLYLDEDYQILSLSLYCWTMGQPRRPASASPSLRCRPMPSPRASASLDMRRYRPAWITRPPSHPASSS
jgi:hypothetical protein